MYMVDELGWVERDDWRDFVEMKIDVEKERGAEGGGRGERGLDEIYRVPYVSKP